MPILQTGRCKDSNKLQVTGNELKTKKESENSLLITNKGFTFLELMAVIFILSLFAAVVFPSFSVVGGSGMKSEAKRMISVLRYLNDTAISTKETCSLKIDLNSRIVSWKGPDFEKTEAFEHISSMELQSRGKIQEGQVTVFFGPLGIQESLVIHLSDEKEKMSVELNQMSGRARIIQNAK